MRFYDRIMSEIKLDNSIKSMLRSTRLISGDNIMKYCIENEDDIIRRDRMPHMPISTEQSSIFIDITNSEILNKIDTDGLGFPNKIKYMGIFSHMYDIEEKKPNEMIGIIESSFNETIEAIVSVDKKATKINVIAAFMDAMKKYNIKYLITRFAIMELEMSGIILTAFMSTVLDANGHLPKCSVTSDDKVEFTIATLTYNFSLPSILHAPKGHDVVKLHHEIEQKSYYALLEDEAYSALIEKTPYGRLVEFISMTHYLTLSFLNCKNFSPLKISAEQVYSGTIRRKYRRHYNHELSNFDILQYAEKNSVPSNTIPKGYFYTYSKSNPMISGGTGSYWRKKRTN